MAVITISSILAIFKLAKESVQSFMSHQKTGAKEGWAEVVVALDKLTELTTLHVRAIAEVTEPAIARDDVEETSKRYSLLVNNPDFPQGYGIARGIIEGAMTIKMFKTPEIKAKLSAVLDALHEFQYDVFTLSLDSYRVSDAIAKCAQVTGDPMADIGRIKTAADPLIRSYAQLFNDDQQPEMQSPVTTVAGLRRVVQIWFQSWQRYVQRRLYDGRGLSYAIGQLRMQSHA